MVRLLVITCSILLLNFCHKPQFNEYGILYRTKEYKAINISDTIYKKLDTLALYKQFKYKSIGDFFIPKEDVFIRFYSNGKMISFRSQITISKEFFRPARGVQGRYFVKKNKLQCSFYNYPYGASGILFFKNDTLIRLDNQITYYYVKVKNVNPEWLEWQPDW